MHKALGFAAALALTTGFAGMAEASPISINFDVAQAGYTPTPGSIQVIDNQFASLGILFRDVEHGGGATGGDCTGGVGSDPVHLYGANQGPDAFGSCGDTTPQLDFLFVNPADMNEAAYTSDFSILVTDGSGTVLSAFDVGNNFLGSVTCVSNCFNERLSLTGLGQISRVHIETPRDNTAYDDIIFESVMPLVRDVPEPASLALLGTGLLGLGLARRRRS